MMRIVVGTTNPRKLEAVRIGFMQVFPHETQITLHGPNVSSGVSDQPWGDAEIQRGAATRAQRAMTSGFPGEYFVGLESGVELIDHILYDYAWVAILHRGEMHFARSVAFPLPPHFVARMQGTGKDLSTVMHECFGLRDAGMKGGAIGHFTNGVLDRASQLVPAIVCALIPHLHAEEFHSLT